MSAAQRLFRLARLLDGELVPARLAADAGLRVTMQAPGRGARGDCVVGIKTPVTKHYMLEEATQ